MINVVKSICWIAHLHMWESAPHARIRSTCWNPLHVLPLLDLLLSYGPFFRIDLAVLYTILVLKVFKHFSIEVWISFVIQDLILDYQSRCISIAGLIPIVMMGMFSNPSTMKVVSLESVSSVCFSIEPFFMSKPTPRLGSHVQQVMLVF